jgi:GH35 family endo-1,4-beta-xylanase
MKVDAVSGGGNQRTRPASLNLGGARTIVNFAEQHGLYMVGHTLVWHSQSAPWLYRNPNTNEYLTRAEAKENMRWFIEQYAGYFGDRIDAWDVTNEVFTNGGGPNNSMQGPIGSPEYPLGTWQRALRNNVPWYHAFANGADFEAGERAHDYIYYAFVFARRYAPSALLIYNDFNEEFPPKRDAMANMTIELNERWHADSVNNPAYGNPNHPDYGRLLIEVIGMQGHYNHGTNMPNVRAAIERFTETGARIHVTELDIHWMGQTPEPFVMSEAQLMRQAEMFADLFTWYEEFSDYIDRITIWGREDSTSWRGEGGATHFDRFFNPKPAFWAIYDPAGWRDRI